MGNGFDDLVEVNDALLKADPLTLLLAWRGWAYLRLPKTKQERDYRGFLLEETLLIKDLQENPLKVAERGKEEGWWE